MSSAATDKTSLGYKLWLKFFGDKANRKNIQNALSVEPPSDANLTALLGVDSQGHTILRKKDAADTIANQSLYEAQSSVALSYQDSEGASHTVLFADSSGIVDPFIFKGVLNCSANPNYPAADAGHVYKVSVAGKIGGSSGKTVEAGDTVYCITDSSATGNEATVGANWVVIQQGDKSYSTDGTLATNSDGLIPTEKAVKTYVDGRFSPMVIPEKTPVNAVAASRVLTVNATPGEGETVVIADNTYKMRLTALGAGEYASAILINDETAPADGDTVTVGTRTYRFKTVPEQAGDIFLGTATATMLSLFKAMHLTGEVGVDYYTGTSAIDIAATAVHTSTFVITVTANAKGYAGNLFAKAESSDHLDWDGETAYFTGGIDPEAANDVFVDGSAEHAIDNLVLAITAGAGEGTKYGTGTVVHPTVTAAKASSSTMTATAKTKGVAGNAITISETLADVGSVWADGETTLGGGVDGTVGVANEICADATYLYHCIATNTIADDNWRQIVLGSAY